MANYSIRMGSSRGMCWVREYRLVVKMMASRSRWSLPRCDENDSVETCECCHGPRAIKCFFPARAVELRLSV